MFQFLESICLDGEGFPLLEYHQKRVNRVFKEVYGHVSPLVLEDIIPSEIPGSSIRKVRVLYGERQHQIEIHPYVRKKINSLQLVTSDTIDYGYKYADRVELGQLFEQRNSADDILIVKNGLLTDTCYANIALLKNNVWHTPEEPLLPGVRRAKLLEEGQIIPTAIRTEDLAQFERLSLFNAMIDLGEVLIPIGNVIY
ncbi:MAG: aminotransferase class IV [Cytophagales bacterium]|nr:aminotransferase class IV [Cytophagales bacterium]